MSERKVIPIKHDLTAEERREISEKAEKSFRKWVESSGTPKAPPRRTINVKERGER